MTLNFKQTSKHSKSRWHIRNSKRYKNFDGNRLSIKKLFGSHYKVAWDYCIRAKVNRWLYKQVGKPIDKVFSEFTRMFNKSYKGDWSPKEYLYNFIDIEKETNVSCYGPKFFISSSNILCRYSKYSPRIITRNVYVKRHKDPQTHIDYNKEIISRLALKEWEQGPKYIGKMWATAKGHTKILNIWIIINDKLIGNLVQSGVYSGSKVYKSQRIYLEQFTPISVSGFGKHYIKNCKVEYFGEVPVKYTFIAKLSDLKII